MFMFSRNHGSSRSHHRATKDLQGDQPCDWEPRAMDGMEDLSCRIVSAPDHSARTLKILKYSV